MNKNYKISALLLVATFFIFAYFLYFSEKVSTNDSFTQKDPSDSSSASTVQSENQITMEKTYLQKIEATIVFFENFFNNTGLNNTIPQENFSRQEELSKSLPALATLAKELENVTVPKKYKNIHLGFSRTILILSSSKNDQDILEALDVYRNAKVDFLNLKDS
jgi:hypothetical protein